MGGEAKHLLWFEFDKTVKPTVSACLQEPPAKKTTSSAGEARCFRGRNPDGFRLEPRSGISDITVDDLKRNYSGFKVPKAQYLTHGPVETVALLWNSRDSGYSGTETVETDQGFLMKACE